MPAGLTFALSAALQTHAHPWTAQCPRGVQILIQPAPERGYPWSRLSNRLSAVLEVTVGQDGKLLEAHTVLSTRNATMDQAALQIARESTYAPRLVRVAQSAGSGFRCQPEVGHTLLKVQFPAN